MRQRQRGQSPVETGHVGGLAGRVAGEVQIGVGKHHPLRAAGGSAGVEQRRQVVVGAVEDRGRVRRLQRMQRQDVVTVDLAGGDHEPDAVEPGHGLADLAGELGCGHHAGGLGVGEQAAQILGREQEGRRCNHRTGAPQRAVDDPDLRAVGHRHHDAIARGDPQLLQSAGDPAGALKQLAGAVPTLLEQQRSVIATALHSPLGEPSQVVLALRAHAQQRYPPAGLRRQRRMRLLARPASELPGPRSQLTQAPTGPSSEFRQRNARPGRRRSRDHGTRSSVRAATSGDRCRGRRSGGPGSGLPRSAQRVRRALPGVARHVGVRGARVAPQAPQPLLRETLSPLRYRLARPSQTPSDLTVRQPSPANKIAFARTTSRCRLKCAAARRSSSLRRPSLNTTRCRDLCATAQQIRHSPANPSTIAPRISEDDHFV